jgi:DeoR family transcriptional regulator, aga operon transcriptional repressor
MEEKTAFKDLYMEERRRQIVKRVDDYGRVSVADLAAEFGVSEVTIRADLQSLADQNLVVRTHGGAVPASRGLRELSLAFRSQQQVPEKDRIGVAGAAMVSHGDAIILDSSSTALAIARHLKRHRELTILTNSVALAYEMLDAHGVTVVMPGGTIRREMASLIDGDGVETFHKFNIKIGFFGAHGITVAEGLTDVSVGEADVKRPLIAMCRQVVAVLDSIKWGRAGVASFAELKQINCVITDVNAPKDLVEQVRALGIQVVLV